MAKVFSPDAPANEAMGADEALILLNQGGRENWTAEQVRQYGDQVYRRRTVKGTSTAQNEQAEGFRMMAYNISLSRPSSRVHGNCSNPRCIRYKGGYIPLCPVCKKEFKGA